MASAAATDKRAAAKMAKITKQMDELIDAKKFYEAQQLYQSLYNRHSMRKQHAEAQALLRTGATQLLGVGQGNAGGELAQMLVQSYEKSETVPTPALVAELVVYFKTLAALPECESVTTTFVKTAIQWTSAHDTVDAATDVRIDTVLHRAFADYLVAQQPPNYALAARHFLRANDADAHAAMLVAWSRTGFAGERDLYVTRAVLQYLCLMNLDLANQVYKAYLAACARDLPPADALVDGVALAETPLAHFTVFLLQTMERDAAPLFEVLRQQYATELARDEDFGKYLDKIGQLYFGIAAPTSLFDGLFSK